MKKIIFRILLISLFIMIVFNRKSYGASDFSYTLDANGNATITAYNGTESNLTIPNTIDGHNVVNIASHAFDESWNSTNGHTIKNLVISEGIERIELLAFAKCTNLETVKLPESLTFLDMQTFLQCSKLKSVNIPSKITSIGNGTFQETGVTEFEIPENVKSIDSRALGICTKLEKVRVYSADISYTSGVFEYGSSNLVLYGYEGSTTQTYAQQNGIEFKSLSVSEEPPVTSDTDVTILGTIKIPKINLESEIASEMSVRSMEKYIIFLYGVGLNKIGNTTLAGHNYEDGRLFSNLDQLQNGDKIYIIANNENVEYEIYKIYETTSADASYMQRETTGIELSLCTQCTNDSSKRLIVLARNIENSSGTEENNESSNINGNEKNDNTIVNSTIDYSNTNKSITNYDSTNNTNFVTNDNTTVKEILPNTGSSTKIFIIISFLTILTVIFRLEIKKYNDF